MKKGKRGNFICFLYGNVFMGVSELKPSHFPYQEEWLTQQGNIPLIGAIVKQEGTKNMAVTDRDGCFFP
jgi:hypothetical protein